MWSFVFGSCTVGTVDWQRGQLRAQIGPAHELGFRKAVLSLWNMRILLSAKKVASMDSERQEGILRVSEQRGSVFDLTSARTTVGVAGPSCHNRPPRNRRDVILTSQHPCTDHVDSEPLIYLQYSGIDMVPSAFFHLHCPHCCCVPKSLSAWRTGINKPFVAPSLPR